MRRESTTPGELAGWFMGLPRKYTLDREFVVKRLGVAMVAVTYMDLLQGVALGHFHERMTQM